MTAESPQSPHPAAPMVAAPLSFNQELCGLVLDTAPRLFAVVHVSEGGTRDADGWVVAWGMSDGDGLTHVVSLDGGLRMALGSPERAVCLFARQPGITTRLVWLAQPGTATFNRAEAA